MEGGGCIGWGQAQVLTRQEGNISSSLSLLLLSKLLHLLGKPPPSIFSLVKAERYLEATSLILLHVSQRKVEHISPVMPTNTFCEISSLSSVYNFSSIISVSGLTSFVRCLLHQGP